MRSMDNYYTQQAASTMPHFTGHYRQRGSGFGALAAGIGRFAFPLARKFILPAAKKIGRELLVQGAPELIDVVTSKKTPKQAIKNTVKKTVKKQVGGGVRRRRTTVAKRRQTSSVSKISRSSRRRRRRPVTRSTTRRLKSVISKASRPKRSRSDFFSKVQDNDR